MTTITLQENILSKDEIRKKTAKPLLWIGIVSIVMFFGGWTSAVIVSKGASSNWLNINLPNAFTISTIIILLSSLSFHYGLIALKKNQITQLKLSVIITLFLGLGFIELNRFFPCVPFERFGIGSLKRLCGKSDGCENKRGEDNFSHA